MPLGVVLWSLLSLLARPKCRRCLVVLLLLPGLVEAEEPAPLRVMTDFWPPFRIAGQEGASGAVVRHLALVDAEGGEPIGVLDDER